MNKRSLMLVVAAWAIAFAGVPANGQQLAQAERERAIRYLESTRSNIVEATKGLSDAQWNFKPSPFRWSVAQVMEHIAAAEDYLRGFIEQQVMKAPAAAGRELKQIDDMVIAMVPDRSFRAEAPQPLRPTNRFTTPGNALQHFLESRAKTEQLLKTAPDLRAHAVESPLRQKLDAYEWILFIAAHSERHTKQLNEVKADPKFPKE